MFLRRFDLIESSLRQILSCFESPVVSPDHHLVLLNPAYSTDASNDE